MFCNYSVYWLNVLMMVLLLVMMTILLRSSIASQCGDDVYMECEEKAQRGLCQV